MLFQKMRVSISNRLMLFFSDVRLTNVNKIHSLANRDAG